MNPGAQTRDECLDRLRAGIFQKANPPMPEDLSLTFRVDLMARRGKEESNHAQ